MPIHGAGATGDIPVVFTQGLTKVFKDFWMRSRVRAVDHLDLEIHHGEIFGLLGPNGSGKSTTIKILLGLLHKTSGLVAVFGKPPNDVAIKGRIGVLPEESYLYPYLNAYETLDYYGKLFELGHHDRKRRIEELLSMVGLTAVAHRQIREYSKGMQRRIGMAQALINDPDFLILDEPTAGLDPIGAKQVKELIVDLGRRGKTVLLSSHQLSDVEDCVDRLVILYGGKKRSEGTCDELLTAQSRMAIETDVLDEGAIEDVERVLETHGASIRRIAKPRQRLEDLFMDIVEQARDERLETGGAQYGGSTAAFLLEQQADGQRGEALIEQLVAATPDESVTALTDEAPDRQAESQTRVIDSLLRAPSSSAGSGSDQDASSVARDDADADDEHSPASAESEPDLGVIESLLSGDDDARRENQSESG